MSELNKDDIVLSVIYHLQTLRLIQFHTKCKMLS